MPYLKKTCRAGKTKEVEYYYSARYHPKGEVRNTCEGITTEAQKQINRRMAERMLTRILNANFSSEDLYITWHYKKELRPANKEEMRGQIRKLLRKLRELYKKTGKVLKYVWVAEIGKKGAAHIHMVVNGNELQKLKKLWSYGHINVQPLDETGQYRKLAEYFIKYSDRTMGTDKELQGKRYNCSRNLVRPKEKVTVVKSKRRYSKDIKVPKGWYLDKESVQEGFHERTGYPYFYYTLIQLE